MSKLRRGDCAGGGPDQELRSELAAIAALDLAGLRARWRGMTRAHAPAAFSRDLLARMIAHRVQEERLGKLDRESERLLNALAVGKSAPARRLKVGTALVREHGGVMHEVMVAPDGFVWRDRVYPSLSTIAKAITGVSWNGPRFFGLRAARGESEGDGQPTTAGNADVDRRWSGGGRSTSDRSPSPAPAAAVGAARAGRRSSLRATPAARTSAAP